jgi:hypothetical protein
VSRVDVPKPTAYQLKGLRDIANHAQAIAEDKSQADNKYDRADAREIFAGLRWLDAALAKVTP